MLYAFYITLYKNQVFPRETIFGVRILSLILYSASDLTSPLERSRCNRFWVVDKRQATNKRDRPEHPISLLIQTSGLKELGTLQTRPRIYLHKGMSNYGTWSSRGGNAGRLRGFKKPLGCVPGL